MDCERVNNALSCKTTNNQGGRKKKVFNWEMERIQIRAERKSKGRIWNAQIIPEFTELIKLLKRKREREEKNPQLSVLSYPFRLCKQRERDQNKSDRITIYSSSIPSGWDGEKECGTSFFSSAALCCVLGMSCLGFACTNSALLGLKKKKKLLLLASGRREALTEARGILDQARA